MVQTRRRVYGGFMRHAPNLDSLRKMGDRGRVKLLIDQRKGKLHNSSTRQVAAVGAYVRGDLVKSSRNTGARVDCRARKILRLAGAAEAGIRSGDVDSVEDVESLGTEEDMRAFPYPGRQELTPNAESSQDERWALERVTLHGAVGSLGGVCERIDVVVLLNLGRAESRVVEHGILPGDEDGALVWLVGESGVGVDG